jgi:quercetin dioxygenase-like cupin family protein
MKVVAARPVTRSKVLALEDAIRRELTVHIIELPVKHHFSQGVYGRELFIPKGTVLTGKIHKYPQLNVLVSGDISVLTEDGVKRVTPPFVVVSPAGTKRAAYAHEDTIWLTVHGTNETDIDKIEHEFVAQTESEYLDFCEALEDKS